jgi:hypothetical protein
VFLAGAARSVGRVFLFGAAGVVFSSGVVFFFGLAVSSRG